MGNYLNRFTQVSTFPLLVNDRLINSTSGNIVGLRSVNIQKALIMPQIKICFSTILGYKAFSMLIGIECSGINIDIGIKFLNGHFQSSRLQQLCKGGCNNSFSQRGGNTTGYKNVLGHCIYL